MRHTTARRVRFEPPMPASEGPEVNGMMNTAPPLEITPRRVRRMPKAWKVITCAFAAVILIPLFIAIVIGTVEGIAGSTSTPVSTVSTFNDGFATSKQDDCAQGFAPACTWLKDQGLPYK